MVHNQTAPRPAAAATLVLGSMVLCTVVGAATEVATTRMAFPLDPLPRVQQERQSGDNPLLSQLVEQVFKLHTTAVLVTEYCAV